MFANAVLARKGKKKLVYIEANVVNLDVGANGHAHLIAVLRRNDYN